MGHWKQNSSIIFIQLRHDSTEALTELEGSKV